MYFVSLYVCMCVCIEFLCLNDGSSPDESGADESSTTPEGKLCEGENVTCLPLKTIIEEFLTVSFSAIKRTDFGSQ